MVRNVNTHQWYFHYMSDILTTCIDLQWRYTILIFVLLYIARNAIFSNIQVFRNMGREKNCEFWKGI